VVVVLRATLRRFYSDRDSSAGRRVLGEGDRAWLVRGRWAARRMEDGISPDRRS
jgi:hypothetical protein